MTRERVVTVVRGAGFVCGLAVLVPAIVHGRMLQPLNLIMAVVVVALVVAVDAVRARRGRQDA